MRTFDINNNELNPNSVDLAAGYLVPTKVIKKDASPIDNRTKYFWTDEDYEEAQIYILNETNVAEPCPADDRDAMLVDLEYRLTLLELGV